MYQNRTNKAWGALGISGSTSGFTMIELLVTLVIIGLLSAVAVPGIDSMLTVRQAAIKRGELQSYFDQLPLKAALNHQHMNIDNESLPTELEAFNIVIVEPVILNSNGYCKGGLLKLVSQGNERTYKVEPPFCRLSPG